MDAEAITGQASDGKNSGRVWKWTKRILLAALLLILAAGLAGMAYQSIATMRDAKRFPQEGRSVALGADFPGVFLNLNCSGAGSPTVILDSGLGVPAAGWDMVQSEVAKFTRVCSYDRAGYGWSTPGPMPRTSGQIVKELHALLDASGEKAPYILVAHSFGGYNVRVYTAQYPADVAGLVLVDTSHEDQDRLMPPTLKSFMDKQKASLDAQRKLAPILIFLGVARLTADDADVKQYGEEFAEKMKYLQLQGKFVDATASEFLVFDQSAEEVRQSGNLGDRPLIVLTAGKEQDLKNFPKGISADEMKAFQKQWIEDLQVREARLSTRGKQVVVPDSTHMIPLERPDAVINAVREVVTAARVPAQPVSAKP